MILGTELFLGDDHASDLEHNAQPLHPGRRPMQNTAPVKEQAPLG